MFISVVNGVFNGIFDLLDEALALLLVISFIRSVVVGAGGISVGGGGGISGGIGRLSTSLALSNINRVAGGGGGGLVLSLALSDISRGNVALGEFSVGVDGDGLSGGGG